MHDKNTAVTEVATGPTEKTSIAAYYAVGMLTLIYSLNFLDRTVITILIDPIKRDYHLSDKMMGFISGFGFVIMYSILGRARSTMGRPRQSPVDHYLGPGAVERDDRRWLESRATRCNSLFRDLA